jgi:hypothetical protein
MEDGAVTATVALARATSAGVRVIAADGRLCLEADVEPPPELLADLRAHRDELIGLLREPTLSEGGAAYAVLDHDGLPSSRCLICDGTSYWSLANVPPEFGPWRCQRCEPRPEKLQAHACAVPL